MHINKESDAYIARYQGRETKGTSFADAIKNMFALIALEKMDEENFQKFFKSLPQRVQMLVRGGMVSWKETLPQYYSME